MKRIITYGTFDLFHEGHYNMLKRAKAEGDYLIVGVTGDRYDVGRGKLSVKDSLATRIENVKKTGFADMIITEEYLGQKISDIIKYDIDTFVIGDDWRGKFDHLNNYCTVKYISRTEGISSTKIREEEFKINRIGIITDKLSDNQIVKESGLIAGVSVGKVYSDDQSIAVEFKEKYGLQETADSAEELYRDSDVVFIRTDIKDRYRFTKDALEAGKHVICDFPFSLDSNQQKELWEIAKKQNRILLDNIKAPYSQTFIQMMWAVQGGLIGEVIDFNCSVSKKDQDIPYLFYELAAMAVAPMLKILGHDYTNMGSRLIYEGDTIEFATMYFDYPTGKAKINVGNRVRVENQMEIIGTRGTVRIGDNWWKADYFEMDKTDGSSQVFNINFDSNGFRFLLANLVDMVSQNIIETQFFSEQDSRKVTAILEEAIANKR